MFLMSLMVLSLMAPTHVSHESYVLYARMLLWFLWLVLMLSQCFKFCVYQHLAHSFPLPTPRHFAWLCVRTQASLRLSFASLRLPLPQVTRGQPMWSSLEVFFDVLKHFLWALEVFICKFRNTILMCLIVSCVFWWNLTTARWWQAAFKTTYCQKNPGGALDQALLSNRLNPMAVMSGCPGDDPYGSLWMFFAVLEYSSYVS